MGLTIVALLLFLAMVAAWVVLPSSLLVTSLDESVNPMPATAAPATAAGQTV